MSECVATDLDIFCAGVLLGLIGMKLGDWLIWLLNTWIGNNQKKIDLELGNALEKMRERLK